MLRLGQNEILLKELRWVILDNDDSFSELESGCDQHLVLAPGAWTVSMFRPL